MRMGSVLSDPASFLRAHSESEARLADAATMAGSAVHSEAVM